MLPQACILQSSIRVTRIHLVPTSWIMAVDFHVSSTRLCGLERCAKQINGIADVLHFLKAHHAVPL